MFEPADSLQRGASLRRRPSTGASVLPESVLALLPPFALSLGRTR